MLAAFNPDRLSDRYREGVAGFRNLRDLASSNRNQVVEIANHSARHDPIPSPSARHDPTPSPSTTVTRSNTSHPITFGDQSNTSEDDTAAAEAVKKRQRRAPPATRPPRVGLTQPSAGRTHQSRIEGQKTRIDTTTALPGSRSGQMLPPGRSGRYVRLRRL